MIALSVVRKRDPLLAAVMGWEPMQVLITGRLYPAGVTDEEARASILGYLADEGFKGTMIVCSTDFSKVEGLEPKEAGP